MKVPGEPYNRRPPPARGYPGRFGKRRIVVEFDPDTFDQVNARAAAAGVPFAEMVRQLVEWGLEAE